MERRVVSKSKEKNLKVKRLTAGRIKLHQKRMNWTKLLTNQCPKCDKILFPNHTTLDLVRCGGFCNFSIRYGKLMEMQSNMQRGYMDDTLNKKHNPAYRKKVATNKKIDKYNKLQKERVRSASNLQEEERLANLRRREAGSRL